MLVFIKLMLCVVIVEVGVLVVRRLAGLGSPRDPVLPEAPARPPRLTVLPPRAPQPRSPPPRRPPPAPVPEGVELEPVAVQPVGAQCRVCANAIESGLMICSACEAPHHDDCWHYNGGCSTYGCRSGVARPGA